MISKEKILNKNNILKGLIFIVVIIALTFLLKYAWAKYISTSKGQGNAEIARWVFKVNGNDTQVTNVGNFAITRTDTDNNSVAPNVLAPGTEGEFEIEIDATGTETMVQYLIDITLIKKPENLRFYLKNSNTDEKIFLNTEDNHLKAKGFIPLNDSKVRTERVFWIWELETGNDENEIRINDELDSAWIGQTMEMQISVTGMQSFGPGDVAIPDGTMAKYDFSEVSWYNVNEKSLSGVNINGAYATSYNVSYGNNYLEFNGNNSWSNLGELNSNYQTLEVTFSIDGSKNNKVNHYIIGNPDGGGGGIYVKNANELEGTFFINGEYQRIHFEENIVMGRIYHVVLTYDGTTEILYVNGQEKGRIVTNGIIKKTARNTVMALGCNPGGASADSGFFNGKIYSVAIYNRALTAEEVSHNAQIALNQANNN